MERPFFYEENVAASSGSIVLNEDSSRHIVQVLRMVKGDELHLTDGKGNLLTARISDGHKKKCEVEIISGSYQEADQRTTIVAISLVKNASRLEWFLEKGTEIGISEIIPMICERTEKQHYRADRMKGVLVSAMLQSRQCRLPMLAAPVKFNEVIRNEFTGQKLIAHCMEGKDKQQIAAIYKRSMPGLMLIGPEGDFTAGEVSDALANGFLPVALGNTRLRTETAGIVAATIMRIG